MGWEDPLEEGVETHSSILAWRIPRTEEPDELQFMGSQKSVTRLRDNTTTTVIQKYSGHRSEILGKWTGIQGPDTGEDKGD